MNWWDKNPVGMVLASACGVLLLIVLVLMFVWSRPAPSGAAAGDAPLPGVGPTADVAMDIGPISEFRVVTERPVFDESRRPSVGVDDGSQDLVDGELLVAGAPEVMLTGVVITAADRLVTLRPLNGGESVIAREGVELEGPYVGWTVTGVEPRKVVLSSREGDSLELDLQVNTRRIEEPPEPVPDEVAQQAGAADKAPGEGDEPPLSRAEEIRQRIAERRAELRREQEMNEQNAASRQSEYQSALRDMIQGRQRSTRSGESNEVEDDKDG